LEFTKLAKVMEKTGNNPLQCEESMDFHLESCKKRYGKVQNFIVENDYGQ
jgi:hypothetical protein